jgi:uncharacterized protein DUF1566/F5/8 type C domain-containing protein
MKNPMKSRSWQFLLIVSLSFFGEAYADSVNLALDGFATQSSTYTWQTVGASDACRAIDGDTDGDWYQRSVSHTAVGDPDPWWQVELAETSPISRIVLWNRTDGAWGARLSNFRVTVLDDSHQEVFAKTFFPDGKSSFANSLPIDLPSMTKGRTVRITLGPNSADLRILALAEVEVLTPAASRNGDVDGSESIDLTDAIDLLNYLFLGGPSPVPVVARRSSHPASCSGENPLISVLRYQDNGDGTIVDRRTGLLWQKDLPAEGPMDFMQASSYASASTLGGHCGWKVPSLAEMMTLVDTSRQGSAAVGFFAPFTDPGVYWTSSSDLVCPPGTTCDLSSAYDISFADGSIDNVPVSAVNNVRLVLPISQVVPWRFRDNGDGTVTDQTTLLTWQKQTQFQLNWYDAESYCHDLILGNHDDWRLPDVDELKDIVDFHFSNPSINPFIEAFSGEYWADDSVKEFPDLGWHVNFANGKASYDARRHVYNVRAVRGAPWYAR